MSLMCECEYDDWPEPGQMQWFSPAEYLPLSTKKARKCCSCSERIAVGDTCCEVSRSKVPGNEIECRIYGEDGEIPMASKYLCEQCADLYFSLEEVGYCVTPMEDQRKLVAEHFLLRKQHEERKLK